MIALLLLACSSSFDVVPLGEGMEVKYDIVAFDRIGEDAPTQAEVDYAVWVGWDDTIPAPANDPALYVREDMVVSLGPADALVPMVLDESRKVGKWNWYGATVNGYVAELVLDVRDVHGNVYVDHVAVAGPAWFDPELSPAQLRADSAHTATWTPRYEPDTLVEISIGNNVGTPTDNWRLQNVPDDGVEVIPETVFPDEIDDLTMFTLEVRKTRTTAHGIPGLMDDASFVQLQRKEQVESE